MNNERRIAMLRHVATYATIEADRIERGDSDVDSIRIVIGDITDELDRLYQATELDLRETLPGIAAIQIAAAIESDVTHT